MIIEIHGAGFQNKGSELMLRTVVGELKNRLPSIEPVIDPLYGSFRSRSELGLKQIFPLRSHVGSRGFSWRFTRQKMFASMSGNLIFQSLSGGSLDVYGCVSLSSIEGLIDIAGFAYTDQWGSKPTEDFAALSQFYRSRKRPIILLPQAFGPFEQPETKKAFTKIVNNANLIFARDQISYDYLTALAPKSREIFQAPDITLFYPSSTNVHDSPEPKYVSLVPNIRMLDQGSDEWGEKYETVLQIITKEIIRNKIEVRIVVHSASENELMLAKRLMDAISSNWIELVTESDPIRLKDLIGESLMVIGSRYHALVSALSRHVPAITLGWSHKYKMLFEAFNCEELVISSDTSIEVILEMVRSLLNQENNRSYRQRISRKVDHMKAENEVMWNKVTDLLMSLQVQS